MRALPDRCRIAPDGEPEPEGVAGVNGRREGLPVILDHTGDVRGLWQGVEGKGCRCSWESLEALPPG